MKKFELKDVPLENVHVSEVKIREAKKDHAKYEEMTLSIATFGVIIPALARPWKDENNKLIPGHIELADGQQRFSISDDLKLEFLPCKIMELTDEDVQVLQMILEREHNKKFRPLPFPHFLTGYLTISRLLLIGVKNRIN